MSDLVQKINSIRNALRYASDDASGRGADHMSEEMENAQDDLEAIRQSLGSAQERGEALAWLTEDGERCVTARTMDGARKDGGAILSSLSAFTVPAYARPAPTDAQSRIAELEAQLAEREKEVQEQARIVGMGAERELSLMARLTESREREGRMREALHKLLSCGRGTSGRLIIERDEEQAAWAALAAEKE